MSDARCASPLAPEDIESWWTGDLSPTGSDRIEEHLFACGECTAAARRFAGLAGAIRRLAREGGVRVVVGPSWLGRVTDEGLRVREYRMGPGGSVACTVAPDDDFVIARLAADLRRTEAVDLSWCDDDGREIERLRDLPVPREDGEILWVQETDALRALGAVTCVARLVARTDSGEHVLAEYTFRHAPTPP